MRGMRSNLSSASSCCCGRRHIGLPDFLEAAATELPCRPMPQQQHHRRLRAARREEGANRVGMAGTAGDHAIPASSVSRPHASAMCNRRRFVTHIRPRFVDGSADSMTVVADTGCE